MKKNLSYFLPIALILTLMLILASCGTASQNADKDEGGHTHTFETESVDVTCTEAGTATLACSCGEAYTVDLPALGHDMALTSSSPATCTEAGSVSYECSRCGEKSSEDISALGHNYAVTVTRSTCTKAGEICYKCSRCNDTYSEPIDINAHSYTVSVTEPTCTKTGLSVYTCTGCGYTYSEELTALGHCYSATTTKATCTEAGVTVYTCARCGDSYSETLTALGHSYSATTNTSTCTKEGSIVHTCSRCNDTYSEALPAINHNYTVSVTDSTCTQAGSRTYTCLDCGDTYSEEIPLIAHNYVLQDFENASCTEDGNAHYVCEDCQGEKNETLPLPGHDYKLVETVAATCLEGGYDICKCSRCESVENFNEKEPLGHKFTFPDGDYVRLVKCEREGCEACGRRDSEDTYTEVFTYRFDEETESEIDDFCSEMAEAIEKLADYNAQTDGYDAASQKGKEAQAFAEKYYFTLENIMSEITTQQAVCKLNYFVAGGADGWDEEYEKISAYKDAMGARYFAMCEQLYNSEYREYIFREENGWTDELVEKMKSRAETTKNEEYLALCARANEIYVESGKEGADIASLYIEFVQIKNEIAGLYGYDNYMDYAYAEVYKRDYTPSDVAEMRSFVKQYFSGSTWFELELACQVQRNGLDEDGYNLLNTLINGSVFTDKTACDAVADYFAYMSEASEGTDIDFYSELNNAFKGGLLFSGDNKRATTNYLDAIDLPYIYFGPDIYSSASAFVHEFGHYISFDWLKDDSIDYDYAETQSQGNEMLFLAFLDTYLDDLGYGDVGDTFALGKLADHVASICLATCVDEFEQIVYTLEYDGNNATVLALLQDGKIEATELQPLFAALLREYDSSGFINAKYWTYVVIKSPGYYISYAMSLMPSLTLYLDATEDFETGVDEYMKLFCITDNEALYDAETHSVIGAYTDILAGAGIEGPFTESTYQNLLALFADSVSDYRKEIDRYLQYYGIASTLKTK